MNKGHSGSGLGLRLASGLFYCLLGFLWSYIFCGLLKLICCARLRRNLSTSFGVRLQIIVCILDLLDELASRFDQFFSDIILHLFDRARRDGFSVELIKY